MQVKIKDLIDVYNKDIKKHYRNKKKLFEFEHNKMQYFVEMKRVLESGEYNGGTYKIFLVTEPKVRVIMSQSVFDKTINHYIARYIIIPKLNKYLNDRNCATRPEMGMSYAIEKLKKDINYYKRSFKTFYVLKVDIKKYFYNIDHNILLNLLKSDFNAEEYNLIKTILASTNKPYINKNIEKLETAINNKLPRYEYDKGLSIGSMTNQFFAIYYLSKLQHYMIANLHLKFISYMDDYIIIHQDKEYLKRVLDILKNKLKDEYHLELNEDKTFIVNIKDGFNFLGYTFKVNKNKLIIRLSSNSKKNIIKGFKKSKYLYENKDITFAQYFASIENYKHSYQYANTNQVKNLVNKYLG